MNARFIPHFRMLIIFVCVLYKKIRATWRRSNLNSDWMITEESMKINSMPEILFQFVL